MWQHPVGTEPTLPQPCHKYPLAWSHCLDPHSSHPRTLASLFDPSSEADKQTDDFTKLVPTNHLVCATFPAVAESFPLDPSQTQHAQQYVHHERAKGDPFSESDVTDTETDSPWSLCWVGYYCLNMGIPPNSQHLGWVLGSGRNDLGEKAVDFLLTPQSKANHVAGQHA